ncbi:MULTISPECIES: recombinase family protein [unclassified Streptomyces]|uniref:recombinase family protein n=1 Tax=unclassified Streptomyces TaxID=2593676 RepID=UPI00339256C7
MTTHLPATFQGSPTGEDGEPWLGYIRVSTWKEEKISPELQETALREWAKRTGRRLIDPLIIDLDATGRNFKRKIMGAIERVEAGEARGVAVWRYSRFGRNRTGNAVNLARLEAAGGRLESATEPVDASTAVGEFQREMIFAFGNFESNRASEQWRETHDHRRDTLKLPATGRGRFGYIWHRRWDARTETLQKERYDLSADDGAAEALYEAYERKVGGDAFATVAGWLNAAGYRTVRGHLWDDSALRKYMDSGFAAGLLRVHDKTCKCGALWKCPNYSFHPGAQPSIFAEGDDLWDRYLKHREQTRALAPRARAATYAHSGLMRHGDCQQGMAASQGVNSQGEKMNGYSFRCSYYIRTGGTGCKGGQILRERVERETRKWLAGAVAEGVDAAAPAIPSPRRNVAKDRARAARERARLQGELTKLQDGLARLQADRAVNPDDYPPGVYEAARDRIKTQRETAEQLLAKSAVIEATPDVSDYEPLIVGLLDEWETINDGERSGILRQLLRRVAVYRVEREGYARATSRIEFHPVWEPDPWADLPAPESVTEA